MRNGKRFMVCLTAAAVMVSTAACSSGSSSSTSEATDGVKTMEGSKLQKIEDNKDDKEGYLVIDVRSKDEYDAGHVKFAINMPIDTFGDNVAEIEDWKDKPVVLVCNSGKKSGDAAEILVEDGFTDVYNADGVKDFEYNLVTWGNVRAKELQSAADDGSAVIIDLRDAKDYEAGHFKDALNMDSTDMDATKDQLPKDKDQLIITHCYSGNKSAVAAQYLVDNGYTNVYNCLDGTKEVEFDLVK